MSIAIAAIRAGVTPRPYAADAARRGRGLEPVS
jgi:hypothetical protein